MVTLSDDPGRRLDKALAQVVPAELALSRSRLAALIKSGQVRTSAGEILSNPSAAPPTRGQIVIDLPLPDPIDPDPQNIPLEVVFEDEHLIVVNKPAGMVVHPGAGVPDGTLVNALLFHCGESLRGIGGALRPGIVHRIDKDTSGLLLVAKTDRAHQGLSAQFAAHSIRRRYLAVCWGRFDPAAPRLRAIAGVRAESATRLAINLPIARHPNDRKKMAVRDGGKHAVTHVEIDRILPHATVVSCALETGRTHQIRVHMAHIGHPLVGDPVYGRNRSVPKSLMDLSSVSGFARQALHACTLGFTHPVSGQTHDFAADIPKDLQALITGLGTG